MKKILFKLFRKFFPLWQVVYTTADGRTAMYTITKPQHKNEFGNYKEGNAIVGFRSFCLNRGGIRSFRYDRIVSLNRA